MLLRPAVAGLAAALVWPNAAVAQTWTIDRRDGVETVRQATPEGNGLVFTCRRGGPRPGTGGVEVLVRVPRMLGGPAAPQPVAVGFDNGRETVVATLEAARGEAADVAPPRRGRNAPRPPRHDQDVLALAYRLDGSEERAAVVAKIAALASEPRARWLAIEARSLGLSARFATGNARRALAGFAQGCRDGLPEPEDEVQGAWHQGLSSADGEPIVTLTAAGRAELGGPAIEPRMSLVCEDRALALRLFLPGRGIKEGFAAELSIGAEARTIRFRSGPGSEEATAEPGEETALVAWMKRADTLALALPHPDLGRMRFTFDIHGLGFATRRMAAICKMGE